MAWFNPWGLVFMAVIMVPNLIFALRCKDGFVNRYHSRWVELAEQIGRFGCFVLMVIFIPGTWRGWPSQEALTAYCVVNAVLCALYCGIWVACWHKSGVFRALALSVIPSVMFLFSGVISGSLPLLAAALLFAPCHILISYKNAL